MMHLFIVYFYIFFHMIAVLTLEFPCKKESIRRIAARKDHSVS